MKVCWVLSALTLAEASSSPLKDRKVSRYLRVIPLASAGADHCTVTFWGSVGVASHPSPHVTTPGAAIEGTHTLKLTGHIPPMVDQVPTGKLVPCVATHRAPSYSTHHYRLADNAPLSLTVMVTGSLGWEYAAIFLARTEHSYDTLNTRSVTVAIVTVGSEVCRMTMASSSTGWQVNSYWTRPPLGFVGGAQENTKVVRAAMSCAAVRSLGGVGAA